MVVTLASYGNGPLRIDLIGRAVANVLVQVDPALKSNRIPADEPPQLSVEAAGPSLVAVRQHHVRPRGSRDFQGFPRSGARTTSRRPSFVSRARAREVCLHVKERHDLGRIRLFRACPATPPHNDLRCGQVL